ncbi:flagellar basal body rod protein FlgB [Paenibacillus methanolicus]|uniref:Flagellar basal body rod protein FlgB n=1 Tax=Paenibacillus methanolicus TaxID=582686 RepID=A0A5S5CHN2_9BACL|nr:flagellar basal body rod protein FlgB [Paenibacillus methanolicus]TYP79270.1 flagellar basal-body rod protein FlgB [Paenibacillus methanolicus]
MLVSKSSKRNEALLAILEHKHKTITSNIANVDTPNYKAQKVVFEDELAKLINGENTGQVQLNRTRENHLPLSAGTSVIPYNTVQDHATAMNNNRNNVDIDAEMVNLASNQLAYNFMIDKVSGHYNKYKKLLTELK